MNSKVKVDHELIIRMMGQLSRQRETYSHEHGDRVRQIAVEFGRTIGMNSNQLEMLDVGAALHDLGKASIPEAILNKTGKLAPIELVVMRQHAMLGYTLASEARLDAMILDIIRHHHENYNGSGYPDHARESNISHAAMIVHIVDTYDALTEVRSYHPTFTHERAMEQLIKDHDKYNPELLAVFTENISKWTHRP